jgi:hypothetical protein
VGKDGMCFHPLRQLLLTTFHERIENTLLNSNFARTVPQDREDIGSHFHASQG